MKQKIISLVQIVLGALCIPLVYIPVFFEVGVFPGEDGAGSFVTTTEYFYYSAAQNLRLSGDGWLLYFLTGIALVGIFLAIFSFLKPKWAPLRRTSYIITLATLLFYAVGMEIASTIVRCY